MRKTKTTLKSRDKRRDERRANWHKKKNDEKGR